MHFDAEASRPRGPEPSRRGHSAGGVVAGGHGDGGWLPWKPEDSGRSAGSFGPGSTDVLKRGINKEGEWFTASWHSFREKYQKTWFFLTFLQIEATKETNNSEISAARGLENASLRRHAPQGLDKEKENPL